MINPMTVKRKRQPRRHYLIAVLLVCIFVLVLILAIEVEVRDTPATVTPVCVPVDPQNVGDMLAHGQRVVECLRGK